MAQGVHLMATNLQIADGTLENELTTAPCVHVHVVGFVPQCTGEERAETSNR
jgi:hypothetical protein